MAAELSDDLKNLQSDVQKWETLEEGALRDKFLEGIGRQMREQHLDRDLHMDLSGDRRPTADELAQIAKLSAEELKKQRADRFYAIGRSGLQ